MLLPIVILATAGLIVPEEPVAKAFDDRAGALVLIDCASGKTQRFNPELCARGLPPCSTFKIWNTAIGLETDILSSADQPFYKWDGKMRSIEGWNHDLTLRQAYAVSCVPAYQALARKIGSRRMDEWLKKLSYGNLDTSAGLDVFWLPAPGRKPLLISPDGQARLLCRLANGELPFSKDTLAILKDVMLAKVAGRWTIYGKTGTSGKLPDGTAVAWFVGYAVSGSGTMAFACVLTGGNSTGKDSRALVEQVFSGF